MKSRKKAKDVIQTMGILQFTFPIFGLFYLAGATFISNANLLVCIAYGEEKIQGQRSALHN